MQQLSARARREDRSDLDVIVLVCERVQRSAEADCMRVCGSGVGQWDVRQAEGESDERREEERGAAWARGAAEAAKGERAGNSGALGRDGELCVACSPLVTSDEKPQVRCNHPRTRTEQHHRRVNESRSAVTKRRGSQRAMERGEAHEK